MNKTKPYCSIGHGSVKGSYCASTLLCFGVSFHSGCVQPNKAMSDLSNQIQFRRINKILFKICPFCVTTHDKGAILMYLRLSLRDPSDFHSQLNSVTKSY